MKELILDTVSRSEFPEAWARQAGINEGETFGDIITASRTTGEWHAIQQAQKAAIKQALEEDKAGGPYYSHEAMGMWIDSLIGENEQTINPDVILPPEK